MVRAGHASGRSPRKGQAPSCRAAVSQHMGRRTTMEDQYAQKVLDPHRQLWGVFDGHRGAGAAVFCAEHMLANVVNAPEFAERKYCEALKNGFHTTEAQFMNHSTKCGDRSGTTAVVGFVAGRTLYWANAGDSCIMVVNRDSFQEICVQHKPNDPVEQARIEAAGGAVRGHRIVMNGMDGLSVSRGIGDAHYKDPLRLVTATPDVGSVTLGAKVEWIILGSDGLFDFVDPAGCAAAVAGAKTPQQACELLIGQALHAGSGDNVTALCIQWGH